MCKARPLRPVRTMFQALTTALSASVRMASPFFAEQYSVSLVRLVAIIHLPRTVGLVRLVAIIHLPRAVGLLRLVAIIHLPRAVGLVRLVAIIHLPRAVGLLRLVAIIHLPRAVGLVRLVAIIHLPRAVGLVRIVAMILGIPRAVVSSFPPSYWYIIDIIILVLFFTNILLKSLVKQDLIV